jgi:hypothetical protein
MSTTSPTALEVQRWLDGLDKERRDLDNRLQPLLEERSLLDDRERLLKELLASFGRDRNPGMSLPPLESHLQSGSVKEYVVSHAMEILREAGEPLHINELHRRFRQKGYRVPGAGEPVNLTTHIRDVEAIRSPVRGIYGLAEIVGEVPTRSKAARRKKRTKKAKRTT